MNWYEIGHKVAFTLALLAIPLLVAIIVGEAGPTDFDQHEVSK